MGNENSKGDAKKDKKMKSKSSAQIHVERHGKNVGYSKDTKSPTPITASTSTPTSTPTSTQPSPKVEKRDDRENSHETKKELAPRPGMFIDHKKAIFSERYKGIKALGKGSFGECILCKERQTGMEVAVKVISKKLIKQKSDKDALLREVEMLKTLDHPNIMKLYEIFEDSGYYYLVGEMYTGGELFDEITSRKRFSEADAARIMQQVLGGINYMHKNKIVHRDLKPENLLLESPDNNANIRIIDFGLSTRFDPQNKMKDKLGTAYYIAPEVLHGVYDEKCDIWSLGVILYILLSGCPPFNGANEHEILARVEKGKYTFDLPQFRKISDSAKDLIRQMLTYIPSMRITSQAALEHEWIVKMTASDKLVDSDVLFSTISNFRQFHTTQKLAQAALLYMASKLTTMDETKELIDVFRKLDKNGDGQLDKKEFLNGYATFLEYKGADIGTIDRATIEAEVDSIMVSVDFDKNGVIDYSEFVTVAMDKKVLINEKRLERAFKMFDIDNSGKISKKELDQLFNITDGSEDTWNEILKADKDNDGEIDFNEFKEMLSKCKMLKGLGIGNV